MFRSVWQLPRPQRTVKKQSVMFRRPVLPCYKISEEPLGALRPQTPDQRPLSSGLLLSEITLLGKTNGLRLPRWGLRKFDGFWPKKAEKYPEGKRAFPSGNFFGFPRMLCIRVGGFQPPGQKHKVAKFFYPIQATAGSKFTWYIM